ncbi:MAG TPA: hypothetical protein VE135_02910 [Pyrinomonadaceae bacterium]|nr:hypothetical protein [Pyrinomonadaceae bacterium]
MNKTISRVFTSLMVLAVTASLAWVALAQDPPGKQPQSANANKQEKSSAPQLPAPTKSTPKQESKSVEVTPESPNASGVSADAATAPQTESSTSTPGASSASRRKGKKGRRTAASEAIPTATMTQAEQTDLSGTYSGVMNCADAGVTGDTTLTITGNQFSLANGASGRIIATTTHGYTAVVMQFGEATPATPGMAQAAATTPKIISLRGRKNGDRLTLSPISGGPQCSFMPSAAVARSRRNRGARRLAAPAAAAESTSNPASAPTVVEPSAGPMPEPNMPRKARTGRKNANANANTNRSMNTNENTGTGNANANSNANAAPSPSPTPPK